MLFTYTPCPQCSAINRISLEDATKKEPICGKCKTSLPLHMGINELSANGLQQLIAKSPLPVVVDFWAPWCGPCKAFAPIFLQAAQQMAGSFVFVKVNTEAHPLAGSTYQIRSIPTLAVFKNSLEKARISGALSLDDLQSWLKDLA